MVSTSGSGRGYERVLQLIEWLSAQPEPVTLNQTAQDLNWPKSSSLLLLRSLVEGGYVRRLPDSRYKLIRLPGEPSALNPAWGTLLRIGEPILRQCIDHQVKETGFIAVLTPETRLRYLSKLLPPREIRYDRDIVALRIPHYVASGLLLLAPLSDAELDDYFAQVPPSAQDDIPQARTRIKACRRDGYAINLEGRVEGAAGVSAPITSPDGRYIAAINIAGPRERIHKHLDQTLSAALDTAQRISKQLAHCSYTPLAPQGECNEN